MIIKKYFILLLVLFSCSSKIEISRIKKAKINNIKFNNNSFILEGSNLKQIKNVQVKGNGINEFFNIIQSLNNKVTIQAKRNLTILSSQVLSFIIQTAHASSTYTVNFTLADGSITAQKLSSMGASSGQILSYNGSNWVPVNYINAESLCNSNEYLDGDGNCNNLISSQWTTSGSNISYTSGKVGIGTSSPYEKMEVTASDENVSLKVENYSSTTARYPKIIVSHYDGNFGGHPMFFGMKYQGNSSAPDPVNNGDILVEFTGAGATNSSYSSATGASIVFTANENFSPSAHSAFISFLTVNPGTTTRSEKMKIAANGDVGIGTSNPLYKLHVEGTVYATGSAGSLSDKRHKKDIKRINYYFSQKNKNALDIINNLNPVSFKWIKPLDKGMEGLQLGFIAQELKEIIPEAVLIQNNKEKTHSIQLDSLFPILVKGVQEQNQIIENQKNKINNLEQKIKKLEQQQLKILELISKK